MGMRLEKVPLEVNLDALLLTTYVSMKRVLEKSGRDAEAAEIDDLIDDSFEPETVRDMIGKVHMFTI